MKTSDLFGNSKRVGTIACFALLFIGMALSIPAAFGSSSPPYSAQGFNVLSVTWGTPTTPGQAGPGNSDVPLTLTLQYIYSPGSAISSSGTLDTTGTGFSPASGGANSTVYYSGTFTPGTIFELTFYLDLNSTLQIGNRYAVPLTMLWSAILSNSTLEPETSLFQSTTVSIPVKGDADLSFETSETNVASGEVSNLNLTVSNNGTGYASNILTSLSSQLAGVQGTIPKIQNLTAGSSVTFPLEIFVPESAAGSVTPLTITASYEDPYGNNASTSQVIDLHSSAASEPSLVYSAVKKTLVPGEADNITVTLTNMGDGNASDIVTTTSGSIQGVSTLVDFPTLTSLGPGSSHTANVSVYISSSAAGQPITLTFSSTYLDPYGTPGSTNQDAGFQIAFSSNVSTSTFSITAINNSVVSGSVSDVSFQVKNTGGSTIYSPVYAISFSQPLVVAGNATYSSIGTSVAPGQSEVFTTELTASPSSTSGIYGANLEISFTDQYGTSYNQSYSVAIGLSGSIELVVQSEAFSQNDTGITVTGNLLDEGSSSAYYSSVFGYLNNSKTASSPDYVGEIDPNTPVPFTISIPYQTQDSSAAGNITILVQFKNSLGQWLNSSSSSSTALESISQIQPSNSLTPEGSGSSSGPNIVQLALVFTIVLVAAGVAIFAVIRRRQDKKAASQLGAGAREKSTTMA